MLEFFSQNLDKLAEVIFAFVGIVCFIITFVRTGNLKQSIKNFEEVQELKFKNYNSDRAEFKQSFSSEVKDYVLNSATNELEELPIPKNIQDYINSHIDTSLNASLERLLPKNIQEDDSVIADYSQRVDDLASIGEAIELAEEYRDKLGLPDNFTIAEIYQAVDKSASNLKNKLASLNKPKEDISNVDDSKKA